MPLLDKERSFITLSGSRLYFAKPTEESFGINGVVRRLSNINRFNGDVPYSVAEHSLLACELATVKKLSVLHRYYALMHELDEATGLGDICTPIKKAFFTVDTMDKLNSFRATINELYNIPEVLPNDIHEIDFECFVIEVNRFYGKAGLSLYDVEDHFLDVREYYLNCVDISRHNELRRYLSDDFYKTQVNYHVNTKTIITKFLHRFNDYRRLLRYGS